MHACMSAITHLFPVHSFRAFCSSSDATADAVPKLPPSMRYGSVVSFFQMAFPFSEYGDGLAVRP
jgi:hypothetical protein